MYKLQVCNEYHSSIVRHHFKSGEHATTIKEGSYRDLLPAYKSFIEFYKELGFTHFCTYIVAEYIRLGNYELKVADCVQFVNRIKTVKIIFKTIEL